MKDKNEPFEALSLPRKEVPDLLLSRYRVYSDADNFVLVEAASAQEALKASGVTKARRIERDIIFGHNILKKDPVPPSVAEKAAAAVTPDEAKPAQNSSEKPDEALSNTEADKLPQG